MVVPCLMSVDRDNCSGKHPCSQERVKNRLGLAESSLVAWSIVQTQSNRLIVVCGL